MRIVKRRAQFETGESKGTLEAPSSSDVVACAPERPAPSGLATGRAVVTPRRAPRQRRSADTVEVILQAAERVLVERGRHALTTTRVAKVAGVSVGSIYQFFPNKEALVIALERKSYAQIFEAFQRAIGDALTRLAAGKPLNVILEEIVETMVRLLSERFRVHGLGNFSDLPDVLQRERIATLNAAVDVVASAVRAGPVAVRPENVRLAVALTMHAVFSLTELGLAYHSAEMASGEAPKEIARMMARYLLGDG
jgi:AcrR family transcriptional regulator